MLGIEKLCLRMERQQTAWLAALDKLPVELRAFRPSPEAWTAAQVLDHLVRVERGTLHDVHRRLQAPGGALSAKDRTRSHGLIRWLLSDARVHLPADVAGMVTPGDAPDWEATIRQWQKSRQMLLSLARKQDAHDRCIFQHVSAGPMDFALVLRYLHAHTRHHEFQLTRLREASQRLSQA